LAVVVYDDIDVVVVIVFVDDVVVGGDVVSCRWNYV